MSKSWRSVFTVSLSTLLFVWSFSGEARRGEAKKRHGEYIVKLKNTPSIFSFDKAGFLGKKALRLSHRLSGRDRLYLAKDDSLSAEATEANIRELSKNPNVEYVEPNYELHAYFGSRKPKPGPNPPFLPIPEPDPEPAPPAAPSPAPAPGPIPPAEDPNALLPNDAYIGNQWALHNPSGASAKASYAWRMETGDDVVVAVMDTGVDYNHRDIKGNAWTESINGVMVHGYNAITGSNDPMDDHYHGTHVAGTIGAVSNNGIGVAGVNWRAKLMGVKFLNAAGSGNVADAILAIDFARENGAQVLNMSWGGGEYSQALYEALERAAESGIVLVAAAGNESNNNDVKASYPANYDIPSMMSVAASDSSDRMASFSNFGVASVDLMAPGVEILSTIPGNGYTYLSGTSMAAPHVSGAAALLLSFAGRLSPEVVKQRIMDSVDRVSGASRTISGGRLNLEKMLRQ